MINNLKKSIDSYKNSIEKFSEDELEVFEQKSFKGFGITARSFAIRIYS